MTLPMPAPQSVPLQDRAKKLPPILAIILEMLGMMKYHVVATLPLVVPVFRQIKSLASALHTSSKSNDL